MASTPMSRNWALDLLRLVAVLLVVWHHQLGEEAVQSCLGLWRWTTRGGWVGVDLFFVLSGYLVGGLLFQEQVRLGSIDWKRFLIRRGLKIYPAFYVLLAVILVAELQGGAPRIRKIFGELFFLQNYLGGLRDHTWSLAVEEHFYLLLTALVVWLARRRPAETDPFTVVPRIFVGVAVACLGLRVLTAFCLPQLLPGPFIWTHLRIDALAFGVLLAYGAQFHGTRMRQSLDRGRLGWVAAGVLLLLPAYFLQPETAIVLQRTVGYTVTYLGAGLLVAVAATQPVRTPPRWLAWAATLGAYSYSIYLWHMEVIYRLFRELHLKRGWSSWSTAGCCVVASLLVGVLLGRCIEWPVLWWRNRVFPSRSSLNGEAGKTA